MILDLIYASQHLRGGKCFMRLSARRGDFFDNQHGTDKLKIQQCPVCY